MFKRTLTFSARIVVMFAAVGLIAACEGEEGPEGDSQAGGSTHNAGRNCIECHGALVYAGTLYNDASGTSKANSGTVVINETDGTVKNIAVDGTGNFYSRSGNPGGGYTATVNGNSIAMVTKPTNGACGSGGCHDGSAQLRVYKN